MDQLRDNSQKKVIGYISNFGKNQNRSLLLPPSQTNPPQLTRGSSFAQPGNGESYLLLSKMIRFLQARALTTEDLFSSEKVDDRELDRVKKIIDKEGENGYLSNYTKDQRVIAEILKQYLLQIEPLLTYNLYDSFLLVNTYILFDDQLKFLGILLNSLPPATLSALKQLFSFFLLLIQCTAENKTDSTVLSNIFGALILRPRELAPHMENDFPLIVKVVKIILDNFEILVQMDDNQPQDP